MDYSLKLQQPTVANTLDIHEASNLSNSLKCTIWLKFRAQSKDKHQTCFFTDVLDNHYWLEFGTKFNRKNEVLLEKLIFFLRRHFLLYSFTNSLVNKMEIFYARQNSNFLPQKSITTLVKIQFSLIGMIELSNLSRPISSRISMGQLIARKNKY